jgi:hypothetical protein
VSKTVKKNCPITGSDEITIKFLDPDELVQTQRKDSDGKYRQVLKPRKEIKTPLTEISCTSLEMPVLAGFTWEEQRKLTEEGKTWCKKRREICSIKQISETS